MKKRKWICIIIISLGFSAGAAMTEASGLEKHLQSRIMEYFDLDTADVEIEIRKNYLDPDVTDFDSLSITPLTRNGPRGLVVLKADVYLDGQVIESGQARLYIRQYREVLVTTARIERNEPVTPDKVTLKRMEITSLTSPPIKLESELSGQWAKRNLDENQIVTVSVLERIPAVQSGQGISIVYEIPGLQITVPGIALQTGYQGETIRVRNRESKKIINCTILDEETVRVESN